MHYTEYKKTNSYSYLMSLEWTEIQADFGRMSRFKRESGAGLVFHFSFWPRVRTHHMECLKLWWKT